MRTDRCSIAGLVRRRQARRTLLAALVCAGALPAGRACAGQPHSDRVVVRPNGGSSRIALKCTILRYTGRSIAVETTAGSVLTYPAAAVVSVQTPQSPEHVRGLVDFKRRQFRKARDSLQQALDVERRDWVRRELLALLVRCDRKLGNDESAAAHFVRLFQSDESTQSFGLIPLAWRSARLGAAFQARAQQWLLGSDSAARLIAASFLLDDPTWGRAAARALDALAIDADPRISGLAQIQRWRLRLRRGAPGDDELESWRKQTERLPEDLRAGACFLRGRACLMRKEHERAAAAFLWLPLVYDDDSRLAARACVEAADALVDAGRKREAAALYREVAVRFSQTEFAQDAARQLKALSGVRGKN